MYKEIEVPAQKADIRKACLRVCGRAGSDVRMMPKALSVRGNYLKKESALLETLKGCSLEVFNEMIEYNDEYIDFVINEAFILGFTVASEAGASRGVKEVDTEEEE